MDACTLPVPSADPLTLRPADHAATARASSTESLLCSSGSAHPSSQAAHSAAEPLPAWQAALPEPPVSSREPAAAQSSAAGASISDGDVIEHLGAVRLEDPLVDPTVSSRAPTSQPSGAGARAEDPAEALGAGRVRAGGASDEGARASTRDPVDPAEALDTGRLGGAGASNEAGGSYEARIQRFRVDLRGACVDLANLQRMAVHGIPDRDGLRAVAWKVPALLPAALGRRSGQSAAGPPSGYKRAHVDPRCDTSLLYCILA